MKTQILDIIHLGRTYPGMRVDFSQKYHNNGNLCVRLSDDEGAFATLSTNTDMRLPSNQFVAKTYSENEGLNEQLEAAGLIKNTGRVVQCGYVECPIMEVVS